LLEWLGMEVSKAILGHTLLIESGTRGARSLGEVGYKMAEQRRNARALSLAATLNAHLVIPLVRMNAGRKPIPFLLPDIQSEIDLGQFSESVDRLARRMRVPASYVREQAQIPEPQGDEEVLTTGDKPSAILADGTLDIPIDVVEPDDEEEPGSDSPNPPKTAPRRRRGR
jgi:phage gp29-like protein